MQQRRRLLKSNRKPVDSFDGAEGCTIPEGNLLGYIHNQSLYRKLVAIAVEMAREACVEGAALAQLETKLLAAKGLQEHPMLAHPGKTLQAGDYCSVPYNPAKKFIDVQEQCALLERMEMEVRQTEGKEQIIFAIKDYIHKKKKTIGSEV
jgi:hypothetical protein